MLSRKTIETYLFFLLRHKVPVALVIALMTGFLAWTTHTRLVVQPDFQSLYPPNHPYIQLYNAYRNMFGTAITRADRRRGQGRHHLRRPGHGAEGRPHHGRAAARHPRREPEQVLSITHPKLKTTMTAGSGIKIVPLMYPRVPETAEDLAFLRQKIYTTEGVHGVFVSEDDKATQIIAGFWEEYFDLSTMYEKLQEIAAARVRRQHHHLRHRHADALRLLPADHAADGERARGVDPDDPADPVGRVPQLAGRGDPGVQRHAVRHLGARLRRALRDEPRSRWSSSSRSSSPHAHTRTPCSRWSATTRSTTG